MDIVYGSGNRTKVFRVYEPADEMHFSIVTYVRLERVAGGREYSFESVK